MTIGEAAKTIVLDTPYEISKQVIHLAHTSSGLSIVSVSGGMQLIYNNFFDSFKEILDKYKKGQGNGIRWVMDIQKESVELVKIFLDLGMQVRHVKNISAMNFAVGDKEVNATIDKMEGGKMIQSLITSTEPIYVKHFYTIFEDLWNKGIDAQKRICDIEEGIAETNIEIIPNPQEGIKNAWKIVKAARKEVSIIFSTANAFSRQIEMGGLHLLKEVSENHKAKVRVLVPTTDNDDAELSAIKQSMLSCPLIDIRSLGDNLQTKITIVLVDRKECLIVELKDDSKDNSYRASGVSTYSDSRSIVSSYVSIFENLWNQTDLYKQLKKSNEQLKYLYDQVVASNEQMKISSKMQKEFINVAAHELRTPVQPILGLAELLHNKKQKQKEEEEQDKEFLTIIIRNARRLQQLTECILDITKIENQSLKLNKEQFSMNSLLLETFTDFRNQLKKEGKQKIKWTLALEEGDTSVVADKNRIIQVILNILNNAIKFTKEGNIIIATEKKDYGGQEIRVKVKDTGPGIDPEVMPRLFSKFVTNSQIGTGLGLFISKSIIEAHGGKIWAENNSDGKGSSFTFSLPLNDRSHVRMSSSSN